MKLTRLSKEERRGYIDEADQFYADPEGFLKRMKLPQRLVFYESWVDNLEDYKDKYREVTFKLWRLI
jgi:hypothetical protein